MALIPTACLHGAPVLRTTPDANQRGVFCTRFHVLSVSLQPDGSQKLRITSGDARLMALLPSGAPRVQAGNDYIVEHPHGAHPWDDPFEAIYPAGEALPERNPAMNQIAPAAAQAVPLTMTSREIAALTGKRHDHVLRDIRAMMGALDQSPNLGAGCKTSTYTNAAGQSYPQYELDKDTCLTLLLGYDAVARFKVVKRWQELEFQATQPTFNIPQTLPDALRLAADLAEQKAQEAQKRIAAETALAEAAPKAQALERIAQAQGSLCITAAAKALQVTPQTLFRLLQAEQWIYRRPGGAGWLGYQNRIQSGLLEHKVTTVTRDDGSEKVVEQCRITPKGLTRLASSLKPITPRPPLQ